MGPKSGFHEKDDSSIRLIPGLGAKKRRELSEPNERGSDDELETIELEVTRFKRKIDEILTKYYDGPHTAEGLWKLRLHLAETSLNNCQALTKYIKKTSEPTANELAMRRRAIARRLRVDIEKTRDIKKLNEWYKSDLAPLLNKAEQAAYLVATSRSLGKPFTWQLQVPIGTEQHVKMYGKDAERFKYLDQTCPNCGSRIDEKGWCGCGTIGGG